MRFCANITKTLNNCLPSDKIYKESKSKIHNHFLVSNYTLDAYNYKQPVKKDFFPGWRKSAQEICRLKASIGSKPFFIIPTKVSFWSRAILRNIFRMII